MKIVSGGQSGADRAALDFAIRAGIPHGGWCPLGRTAEDGPIPARHRLRETASADPAVRTEANVRDSDATVIFARAEPLTGGTALTRELAESRQRPVLVLLESSPPDRAAGDLRTFLAEHRPAVLNVAGPRESQAPGIGRFVAGVLELLNHDGVNRDGGLR